MAIPKNAASTALSRQAMWGSLGPQATLGAAQLEENTRQWNLQWEEYLKQMAANQAAAGSAQSGLSSLVNQYNKSFAEAKAVEDARYREMLGLADTATGQRAADIRSDYATQRSNMMQNLARTGMANTTVAPTLSMGIEREQQSALNRLTDQMLGTKLGIMQGKQERFPTTDIIKTIAQLIGQQTQPQYGSGPIPLRAPGSGYGAGEIASAVAPMKL